MTRLERFFPSLLRTKSEVKPGLSATIERREDKGIHTFYARTTDGQKAGFALASKIGDSIAITLSVWDEFIRQGYGTALFKAVEGWARVQGASEIVGNFEPTYGYEKAAAKFYQSLGVQITSKREIIKKLR